MKKVLITIISFVVIITICIIYIENTIQVCEVVHTSDIEKEYENIVSENSESDCLLIRNQVVTEGTEYCVEQSTNPTLIESSRDIILYDWINPSSLSLNNGFTMSAQVEYVVILPKDNKFEKENKYNEEIARVKPQKIVMLTRSDKIFNDSSNGSFYLKDLSLAGHIRFYVGIFMPSLRESF